MVPHRQRIGARRPRNARVKAEPETTGERAGSCHHLQEHRLESGPSLARVDEKGHAVGPDAAADETTLLLCENYACALKGVATNDVVDRIALRAVLEQQTGDDVAWCALQTK